MPATFYSSQGYRQKQSLITKNSWKAGKFNFLVKPEVMKRCKNSECCGTFYIKPGNPKVFCSKKCAAHFNNLGRVQSAITRRKISHSISILPKRPFRRRKALIIVVCKGCNKEFEVLPYLSKTRKYCGAPCAIKTIGRRTTSALASKGKSGVRKDVSSRIIFYSTWEANIARVYNLVGINWSYAPKIFDLGEHTYRPDFYLSDFDLFY